jgi:formiminoglutamate deiminase
MSDYWCELAWLGGERAEPGVLVETEGERITSVEAGVASPPAGAERLAGLTLPGFANAHSHAFQRALRGRAQERGGGSFWDWRERMYELAGRIDPDNYLALARACFAEMALAGITTVGEFHYLHHRPGGDPYEDPNALGLALILAAREAGIRITLLDACYLDGGVGESLAAEQRRFGDADAAAWAERVEALAEGPGHRVGAAIHSLRAVDPEAAKIVASWAAADGRQLHAHVSEQPAENEAVLAAYGRTPTAILADAGALAADFTAVHATHLTGDDVALLGDAAVCCCLCPTTERDLGDGIGAARRLADAGCPLALGSDSQAVIDPFEEARALELDQRLATGERGVHSAAELLRAATADGHRCLGWEDAGRIEAGMRADLVTVALAGPRLAGTAPEHALESIVYAAAPPDVSAVVSGGRGIVTGGAHVSIDVAAALDAAIAALEDGSA